MKRKTVFRDCTKSDLKVLQKLVQELYYTDAGANADVPEIAFTYRSLSAKPDKGRLVVFEQNGELVGYAILIFFFSSEFGGDIIDVDEVLVTEDARGKGVGNSFFNWIGTTYKKAVGWSLQVRPGNKKARKLYESLGFLTSANLHLYNIFAWNDRQLLRGEADKKKENSRKTTTGNRSANAVSKGSASTKRTNAASKSKTSTKTASKPRVASVVKTSTNSAKTKVKPRVGAAGSVKHNGTRSKSSSKAGLRKRTQ